MSRLRRWLAFDRPQEVTFFLFMAAFALVITIVYWFASYEPAGTVLLGGFTLATGAVGLRLAVDPRTRRVRDRAARDVDAADQPLVPPDLPDRADPGGEGPTSGGTGGVDRPFLDESGRLPRDTLAPFAVGLGVAIAATGTIFGLAPVLVGLLPLVWGGWAWLGGARAELEATADEVGEQAPVGASTRRREPRRSPERDG